jgi:hypothetical protein
MAADVQELSTANIQRVILRMDVWNGWNGGRDRDIAQTAPASAFTRAYETFTGC